MSRPQLNSFNEVAELLVQQYERYIPTAFDGSLTLLEKVNKIIQQMNILGKVTNDVIKKWNEVMEWILNEGITEAVNDRLDEMIADGTFDSIIQNAIGELDTRVTSLEDQIRNLDFSDLNEKFERYSIDIMDRGAIADGVFDNSITIQNAIDELQSVGGGTLRFGKGNFLFKSTIKVPERIKIVGNYDDPTLCNLKYTGTGFAFETKDGHMRNAFEDFSLNLNFTGSGIKIGQSQADRNAGKIPRQHRLKNIRLGEMGMGVYGVRFENASHVLIESCRLGYGQGGIGLSFWNDNCNAGVVAVLDTTCGRYNEMQVGLEIDSTFAVGMDSYSFVGCYFGGNIPIRLGTSIDNTTNVRNITFLNAHVECTKSSLQGTTSVDAIRLGRANNVSFHGLTFAGFNDPNMNCFNFQNDSKNLTILGVDANECMGKVYYNSGGFELDNSIIGEATKSGSNTAGLVMWNGSFVGVTRLMSKFLVHENIKSTYFIGATGNKQDWGTQSPASDSPPVGRSRGDVRFMQNGAELGTAGSKYTLIGWKCIGSGTPGTWVEMRALTGN